MRKQNYYFGIFVYINITLGIFNNNNNNNNYIIIIDLK